MNTPHTEDEYSAIADFIIAKAKRVFRRKPKDPYEYSVGGHYAVMAISVLAAAGVIALVFALPKLVSM